MALFVALIKKEPLSAAEGPALKAKHIPVFPVFPVSNQSPPQAPPNSQQPNPSQTNPYFTFWLQILQGASASREEPPGPGPRELPLRHLGSGAGARSTEHGAPSTEHRAQSPWPGRGRGAPGAQGTAQSSVWGEEPRLG